MFFKNLEDKQLYFRSLSDYKLIPSSHVIVMLDGRSFSKMIKNKFKKPFDDDFIDMMNKTAAYLCQNVQNCKFAFVQSDEISLYLCDFENPKCDSFFGYRLCKMNSIMASMAAGEFNRQMAIYKIKQNPDADITKMLEETKLIEFDCKCWNVPSANDVFGWFLYRQIDCVRNSKGQAAQTYISHKNLCNLNVDVQIQKLKEEHGIDWNEYEPGKKYGRLIYKEKEIFHNEKMNIDYERSVWKVHPAFPLMGETGREDFKSLGLVPELI